MWLMLLGCSEPIWYPTVPTDAPTADTSADTSADTGSVLDTGEDTDTLPCSVDGGASVNQTISNGANVEVAVLWRAIDCSEYEYHTLLPGQEVVQQTYAGHVWVARDLSGAYIDHTDADGGLWEVTP